MDISIVIGLVLGVVLLIGAIMLGGTIGMFVNIPSVLVVVGGTSSSLFIRYKMNYVFGVIGIMMNAFFPKSGDTSDIINTVIELASVARKDGILALEKAKPDDAFLASAINHCVDGADPEFLEAGLNKEIDYLADRHEFGKDMFDGNAEAAHAFGSGGTLNGLVQMLR